MTTVRKRWLYILLLGLILLFAFALRTYNVDWAQGQLPHPDERSTIAFYAPSIRWPSDPGTLFDPRESTLNPFWDVNSDSRRSFTYGHFPLYLMVIAGNVAPKFVPVAEAIGVPERYVHMMQIANGSPGFAWVGRLIMAFADTITILYLFLLGRRLYNVHVGLLAAAFGAFTVLQIQLAHFFAVDPISTTFTVAAIYHAIRMVETRGWKHTVLTGVMAGLAIASKYSAAPILAAPAVAGLIITWRQQHELAGNARERSEFPGLFLTAGALVVAVVIFAVTSPFVLLDFENFYQAVVKEQGAMVRGEADFPFTRQYRGTIPYLYYIVEQVRWGMGWFLGLVGWIAFAWVLVKTVLRRALPGELIILSWLVPYFLITGAFLAKFNRYMVPVVPLLAVLGAAMLWAVSVWLVRHLPKRFKPHPKSAVPAQIWEAPTPFKDDSGLAVSQSGADTDEWDLPDEPLDTSERVEGSDGVDEIEEDLAISAELNRSQAEQWTRRLFWVLGLVVLIPTIIWSLAFVNGVYGSEHTFITASEWMYENVPDGSVWITEHWEEGMPLHLPITNGHPGAHNWRNLTMPMYEEDTQGKYEILKQNMREGDYYVLATKRLYGALPHLPERYPMSIRFYELLFEEQLGYELVGDFTNYPSLFGIEIADQDADESFWVYDHPRTLIFEKRRALSDAEWDSLLGGLWEEAIPGFTGQRTQDGGLDILGLLDSEEPTLLLEQPVNELPDVGKVAWNPFRNNSFAALLFWWLALALINILTWPIVFSVFSNMRDRGYGFSRALGLILVAWISWILSASNLLINSLLPIALALVAILALSAWTWRQNGTEMRSFIRVHRSLLLLSEGIFSIAFLLFIFIRLLNPDLWQPWQGGEKFMEFAFLNAVTRTPSFPPYDPYFAGGIMNYYYYGYQILSSLIKLTGINTTIAFNLAIPTLFALTASGVFSLVYSLMPRSRLSKDVKWWRRGTGAGLLGVFIVVIMGNLDSGLLLLRQIGERSSSTFTSNLPFVQSTVHTVSGLGDVLSGQLNVPAYNYWTPSRVIPDTINEFPFWSFLFADLHPHMMGIPFTVLFLALSYNLVAGYGRRWDAEGKLQGAMSLAALPLVLGAIGAINTWDLPTYFGLGIVAWLIREWKSFGRIRIAATLVFTVGLGALAYLLYLPFYSNYTTVFNTGVGLTFEKTDPGAWLRIWGFFIFIATSWVLVTLRYKPGDVTVLRWISGIINHLDDAARYLDHVRVMVHSGWDFSFGWIVIGLMLFASILLAIADFTVIALILPLLTFATFFLFRRSTSADAQFRTLLFFTGLLVLLGVEVFYLKDFLCGCGEGLFDRQHGNNYRMNTLFKFYIQVWVMLGIAAAASLPALIDRISTWHRGWRILWLALLVVLIIFGLVFPIMGTASRVDDRFPGERPARNTLDGMAFMSVGTYTWPVHTNPIELTYDYDAIRWLQDNVTGTPVLAEAPASWYMVDGQNTGYDYYRAGGLRASSLTGLPTFIGQHQGEQRFGHQTGPREQLGREFWETTDIARLRQLIDELNVDLIYIGQLERTLFDEAQLSKFHVLADLGEAEVIYQNDGVTMYKTIKP
ncbi:MAG: hypothetical protein GY759_13630 [Chloroflexi bacterium]|nr:hypothetical protein [Chloroflexota bacterium]